MVCVSRGRVVEKCYRSLEARGNRIEGPENKIGIAGLGRPFLMMPTLVCDERLIIVAGADPREEARARFELILRDAPMHGSRTCAPIRISMRSMSQRRISITRKNVTAAAAHRKHILCEKPMALSVDECLTMIDAAKKKLACICWSGHSHSFDGPIRQARRHCREWGVWRSAYAARARLYRLSLSSLESPRNSIHRKGGGIIYNQTPHQVDNVRFMGGGMAKSVRAITGAWIGTGYRRRLFSTVDLPNGAFANMTYSAMRISILRSFVDWIAESGHR